MSKECHYCGCGYSENRSKGLGLILELKPKLDQSKAGIVAFLVNWLILRDLQI
jgi:hypothetical protein